MAIQRVSVGFQIHDSSRQSRRPSRRNQYRVEAVMTFVVPVPIYVVPGLTEEPKRG